MTRRPLIPIVMVVALVALPQAAGTQNRWSWPDRAENLKVLPEDSPPERLRAVMTGFTRALGVRCNHCHVGAADAPLSEYDFPSDENPTKDVARAMLRMLGDINEHLDGIEPSGAKRVNMWCHTCHRGQPRPQTLVENLSETYDAEGGTAAVARYRALHERYHGRGSFDFGEGSLNEFGYQLLEAGFTADAVAVFELNAEQFPQSANVWDSLAEACLAAGERDRAIGLYEKSLAMDPENRNAKGKLEELRGGATAE